MDKILEVLTKALTAFLEYLKIAPKVIQYLFVIVVLAFGYVGVAKWATIWPFDAGTKRIPLSELVQYEMTVSHSGESPSAELIVHDDARGKSKVRLYDSDLAMQIVRSAPGARTVAVWFPAPRPDPVVVEQRSPSLGADAAVAGEMSGYEAMLAHGEPAKQWKEPGGQPGVWHHWMAWDDGCYGYLVFYEAHQSYLLDSNGNPVFTWVRFQH